MLILLEAEIEIKIIKIQEIINNSNKRTTKFKLSAKEWASEEIPKPKISKVSGLQNNNPPTKYKFNLLPKTIHTPKIKTHFHKTTINNHISNKTQPHTNTNTHLIIIKSIQIQIQTHTNKIHSMLM